MKRLSNAEIAKMLGTVPGWKKTKGKIRKTIVFRNFVGAMAFTTSVALLAESAHHHPLILVQWNTVTLRLWTHSAGGLTKKDFALAKKIDGVCESIF